MPHVSKDYEIKNLPDQVSGFSWNLAGGALSISGACPECAGEIDQPLPDVIPGAVSKGWPRRRSPEDEVPERVYMRCDCEYAHRGDDRETGGCGAAWTAVRPSGGTP
ncbi:hypothetical protein M878_20590 [Streptomyces roseochromogenus subsp. oscitans DS 12.976]|uniref:Uncharacterized protein n=1 Tax=Streptomyces roseochromogenus subsp. oscitans DS 12.976 TaxID=1352936 RepID=V6KBJ3_STRRC|nr:hypothetical protein M878_20590 [Streptomyces roseochromogenus subsp. oscitans DS 12.976]